MKKIAVALIVIAAIAFVAVGQIREGWNVLSERLGLQAADTPFLFSHADEILFNAVCAIVDRIDELEDHMFLLHSGQNIVGRSEALEDEPLHAADYIDWTTSGTIPITNGPSTYAVTGTDEVFYSPEAAAAYIREQRESDEPEIEDAEPWTPKPVLVFTAGAVLGAFLVLLVTGQ